MQASFKKLENILPTRKGRKFFGIYQEDNNGITYKAAVLEQFENEAKQYGCEYFILEKGNYLTEVIENWQTNTNNIGNVFDKLFENPNVDANSPSIEYYKTLKNLVCIVKLK